MNVDELLAPISPAAPCGRFEDPRAVEVMRAEAEALFHHCHDTEAGTKLDGTAYTALEVEAAWRQLQSYCIEMMGRAKHVYAAVYLTMAGFRLEGLQGLYSGLLLTSGLLERYWDQLYPSSAGNLRLRVLRLQMLSPGPATAHRSIHLPLEISRLENLEEADVQLVERSIDVLERMDRSIRSLMIGSPLQPPTWQALLSSLRKIAPAQLMPAAQSGPAAPSTATATPPPSAVAPRLGPESVGTEGRRNIRAELESICNHYRKHEPSSPIPLLLERAIRLIDRPFLEILENLSPETAAALRKDLFAISD